MVNDTVIAYDNASIIKFYRLTDGAYKFNITFSTAAVAGMVATDNKLIVYWNNPNNVTVYDTYLNFVPIINITFPTSNNLTFITDDFQISYTVLNSSNLIDCWWTRDIGITNITFTCGTNISGQIWSQGKNNITIYVKDLAGDTGLSSRDFNIDTCIPPAINNNWHTYFQNNCTLNSYTDLGTGNLTISGGPGIFTLKAGIQLHQRIMTCGIANCAFIFYPMLIFS